MDQGEYVGDLSALMLACALQNFKDDPISWCVWVCGGEKQLEEEVTQQGAKKGQPPSQDNELCALY